MQYVMLVAGSQPVDFSTNQFLYGNIFFSRVIPQLFPFFTSQEKYSIHFEPEACAFYFTTILLWSDFLWEIQYPVKSITLKISQKTRLKVFIFFLKRKWYDRNMINMWKNEVKIHFHLGGKKESYAWISTCKFVSGIRFYRLKGWRFCNVLFLTGKHAPFLFFARIDKELVNDDWPCNTS